MKRALPRPTYANLIATLALFLALCGGAYAATQLPRNSVGTAQIKARAVTPAKLSTRAKQALTGARGPAGPAGAAGPQGPTGPSELYAQALAANQLYSGEVVHKVLSTTLPAGSYLITAKQTLLAVGAFREYRCFLSAGGTDLDISRASVDQNDEATLVTSAAIVLNAPTEVGDYCASKQGSFELLGRTVKLSALKVGAVH